MSKYVRQQPSISRNSDESIGEDHWLKQFEKNLQKSAVQPRRVDQSLFEQISSIMNNKSKYPSVQAAVDDMKNRSGLTAYLDKIKVSNEEVSDNVATKTANVQNNNIPTVIAKKPEIAETFKNCIEESRGNLPVPAIIARVQSIHKNDLSDEKDWDEDKLKIYVSGLNLKEKSKNMSSENYYNLGKHDHDSASDIDASNTDAFHSLMPAKT